MNQFLFDQLDLDRWVLLTSAMCDWAVYRVSDIFHQYVILENEPVDSSGCNLVRRFNGNTTLINEYLSGVMETEDHVKIVCERMVDIQLEYKKTIFRLRKTDGSNMGAFVRGSKVAQDHAKLLIRLLT